MKINKRHLFLGVLGLLTILIAGAYFYLNQSHRNIQKEEARFTLTSYELVESFQMPGTKTKMADQVVQTKGRITALGEKSLTLDEKVDVDFLKKLPTGLARGSLVLIKGRCVGYDDLLNMVKVDQAMLIEQF